MRRIGSKYILLRRAQLRSASSWGCHGYSAYIRIALEAFGSFNEAVSLLGYLVDSTGSN